MRKSSQAVSLVLIGSTFLFFGCETQHACNQVGPDGKPSPNCSGSTRGAVHGGYYRSTSGSTSSGAVSGTGSGTSAPGTGTTTGGFGAHGSSSSSAVS